MSRASSAFVFVLSVTALSSLGCPEESPGDENLDERDGGRAEVDAAAPSRFKDLMNGTVEDSETGLIWQQPVDDFQLSYELATKYCPALALADKGFRIPTREELESLLVLERWPAIDPVFFPGTYVGFYWTSDGASNGKLWAVRFDTGEAEALDPAVEYPRVRCVK
jgi:hypothetical protein